MKTICSTLLLALSGLVPLHAASVGVSVTPERDVILKDGSRDAVIQIELKASDDPKTKRKTPLNLALVLDRSGSMAGAKLEKARQAAEVALDQLQADDLFSLVVYDDAVEVVIPPQKVKDKDALRREIRRIKEGGSTALYAGVEKGAAQLRKYFDSEKINRIILLSDGLANVGPSTPAALSQLGKELRKEGMSVSTVGVGDDYNEDLMTALAESGQANYYYVKDADKLPGIFEEELGTLKNIAARNISIRITLPDGVKPRGVLGEAEFAFSGQTLVIPLTEISSSQTRRFLIECALPKSDAAELDVAKVDVSYDDSAAGRRVQEDRAVVVKQSSSQSDVDAATSPEVSSQVAITRNRIAKEEAMRLADAGRSKEAAAILLKQTSINAALPDSAQSPLLREENEVLRSQAQELQDRGSFSKGSRKEMQWQNYQDKKQKR